MLWFNPSWQLSPIQLLTQSLPVSWGKGKSQKLVGGDEDSLMGKATAVHTGEAKQGISSPLLMGRRVFRQLQESPSHVAWVTWENKCYYSNIHPFLLPWGLCTDNDVVWAGISLWSVASPVLVVPAPNLCLLSLLSGRVMWEAVLSQPWCCVSTAHQ